MIPDLNRLRIFNHVYVHGSVTQAARELKLSQPAISQHLKKLEKELRIPLFTRTNRKLVPTPAARRLYERMSPLMRELYAEIKFLRRPLDTPYGLLRIGAPELFGGIYLGPILTKFRYRFPTVTFELSSGSTEALLSSLSAGTIDVGLAEIAPAADSRSDIALRNYTFETVIKEHALLVCSTPYYSRYIADNQTPENLVQQDFLKIKTDRLTAEHWFQHHHNMWPDSLNHVLTTDNHELFLSAVRKGMGIGILPRYLAKTEIDSGSITVIAGSDKELLCMLTLVQLKDKIPSLTEKAFTAVLTKELSAVRDTRHAPGPQSS